MDVCLYLLPPTGHGIKRVDMETLKRIQVGTMFFKQKIKPAYRIWLLWFPVLQKLTVLLKRSYLSRNSKYKNEIKRFFNPFLKFVILKIKHQLKLNKVANSSFFPHLNSILPLSLIGSNTTIKTKDGQNLRVRKYPWGIVNTEDEVEKLFVEFFSDFFLSGTLW